MENSDYPSNIRRDPVQINYHTRRIEDLLVLRSIESRIEISVNNSRLDSTSRLEKRGAAVEENVFIPKTGEASEIPA